MRISPFVVLSGFLAISGAAAHADTFDFSAVGTAGGYSGTGVLTATNNGNGSYTVTGISGTGVTGLLAPGTFGNNDNLLFQNGGPLVDVNGIGFTDMMGGVSYMVNLYSSAPSMPPYSVYVSGTDGTNQTNLLSFDVTPVATTTPEPSSLVLLGSGVLGLAGAVRRRLS